MVGVLNMAFPVLIPVVAAGVSYTYGKYFSDTETPKSTAASVATVTKYSLAGLGIYFIYKKMRG